MGLTFVRPDRSNSLSYRASVPQEVSGFLYMKIEQRILTSAGTWKVGGGSLGGLRPSLAFVFGARAMLANPSLLAEVRRVYPEARLVFASAASIVGIDIYRDALGVTAIAFENTKVGFSTGLITRKEDSYPVACELARQLVRPELAHVFVVVDGRYLNASELVRGFNETLPAGVAMTGGLASEEAQSFTTLVGLDMALEEARVVAIGFYGSKLRVGIGVSGGWVPFGPERLVTRAEGNTLYDLDGLPVLGMYKNYLGEQASELPAAVLRFPLAMTPRDGGAMVVRAGLGIDEAQQSMQLAGDIPAGARVRFLRASYEDLIDGAGRAAELSRGDGSPELAICVSCIGRQLVLGHRTEEEMENIGAVFGSATALTGFYSHGELAPTAGSALCQLHNETMTITTFREVQC